MANTPAADRPTPVYTVVVGSRWSEHDPSACLAALSAQMADDLEVVVADDGAEVAYPEWVRRVERPGALVPELWSRGLEAATGEWVALLSGGVVPEPGWVEAVRAVAAGNEAAVGGPVEPGHRLGVVDWAIYFCRYTPYMRPLGRYGLEPAGDNVVYRADVLRRYYDVWSEGFWEPFIHAAMAGDGHRLGMHDDLCVALVPGARGIVFARQRFEHGRSHGIHRSAAAGPAAVVAGVVTAPAVPFLMAARAGRLVATKRRHRARFLVALPVVMWFYSWWAAGELAGRLEALGATVRRRRT